jgi:hypothetical protein
MIVSFVIVAYFEIKHVRNFKTIHWIISSGGREKKGGWNITGTSMGYITDKGTNVPSMT